MAAFLAAYFFGMWVTAITIHQEMISSYHLRSQYTVVMVIVLSVIWPLAWPLTMVMYRPDISPKFSIFKFAEFVSDESFVAKKRNSKRFK
jgi:hypothetical protein